MSNEKLAEALRKYPRPFRVGYFVTTLQVFDANGSECHGMAKLVQESLNQAAEAAQAQAQYGATLTTEEVRRIACRLDPSGVTTDLVGIAQARGVLNAFATMLAATPQQAAEPVASIGPYWGLRYEGSESIAKLAEKHGITIGTKLYTHPQPAQDAKDAARYRWLAQYPNLYTVNDLLRADQYTTLTRACDALMPNAAMAKESGR